LPKGGEINFIINPEIKYQRQTKPGPAYPTNSDNFLENNIISKVGFVKFE
jgi:hypothetical protein